MPRLDALKARLDGLCAAIGETHVAADPIQFPRRYARDDDREVAGFVAAALAYGRVAHIRNSAETVLALLGEHPAAGLRRIDRAALADGLAGFSHRFNTGDDVAAMLAILARILGEHGSIESAFLRGYEPGHADVGPAIAAFSRLALHLHREIRRRSPASRAGVRFFFSSPEDGSACKRMNMYLRWMVRKDAIDLGVWSGVPASRLVMPLDTHTARVCRRLRLSSRRSADWRMALEVTSRLRRLDPDDPIRYDFALFNLGLSGNGRRGAA